MIEASTEEIFAAAVEQGIETLRLDGVRLCPAGVSAVEEIRRVTGDRLVERRIKGTRARTRA